MCGILPKLIQEDEDVETHATFDSAISQITNDTSQEKETEDESQHAVKDFRKTVLFLQKLRNFETISSA